MTEFLNKKQIIELLPHREPMLLIDELYNIKKIEIYDSLIKVITYTNILISDRINYEVNLNRLVIAFQDLQKLFKREIKSIDMRYSNGFAIK